MSKEWEDELEWPRSSLYIRNAKRTMKSGLFETGALYLYRWQLMQLNDQNGSVFAVLLISWCERSYTLFIFIFRSTNQQLFSNRWAKSGNDKRVHWSSKINSTSKGFGSRLEGNFPKLILLFPLSKIWKITQNTGKVSFNFKFLSAEWQRRSLSAKCISSLWW